MTPTKRVTALHRVILVGAFLVLLGVTLVRGLACLGLLLLTGGIVTLPFSGGRR